MIAISRVSVNHREKQRKVDIWIDVDLSTLPGPPGSCVGLGFRLMVGASLVPMLQPGRKVSVCCVSFYPLWVRFTCQLTLGTWGTMGHCRGVGQNCTV